MNEETHQKLMTIKRSFRLLMNGPGSQSMRDKGLGYKLNWGVPFYELKKMAEEYGKDYDLAIELWKEDIRECKILATLIMPADKMLPEITDLWMEQVQSQEMAEMCIRDRPQTSRFQHRVPQDCRYTSRHGSRHARLAMEYPRSGNVKGSSRSGSRASCRNGLYRCSQAAS